MAKPNSRKLNNEWDRRERALARRLSPIITGLNSDVIAKIKANKVQKKLYRKPSKDKFVVEVVSTGSRTYSLMAKQTASEIGKKTTLVITDGELKEFAGKMLIHQEYTIYKKVVKTLKKTKDKKKAVANAIKVVKNNKRNTTNLAADWVINQNTQRARNDVFDKYRDEIDRFEWVGISDDRICPICRPRNQSVEKTRRKLKPLPPLHIKDRCIIVAYMKNEKAKPPIRPIPASAPPSLIDNQLSRCGNHCRHAHLEYKNIML